MYEVGIKFLIKQGDQHIICIQQKHTAHTIFVSYNFQYIQHIFHIATHHIAQQQPPPNTKLVLNTCLHTHTYMYIYSIYTAVRVANLNNFISSVIVLARARKYLWVFLCLRRVNLLLPFNLH